MSKTTESRGSSLLTWPFLYVVASGLLLLALGWASVIKGNSGAASVAFVLGGGSLVVAPFVPRLEGKLRIGPVELTLRQQVVEAARTANESSLDGILPLLTSGDVSVERLRLVSRFAGHRLVDPELAFLRQKLGVSILGVRKPDEEHWQAGGTISDLELSEGTELLAAGPPDVLHYLAFLLAADTDDLWARVM